MRSCSAAVCVLRKASAIFIPICVLIKEGSRRTVRYLRTCLSLSYARCSLRRAASLALAAFFSAASAAISSRVRFVAFRPPAPSDLAAARAAACGPTYSEGGVKMVGNFLDILRSSP